MLLEWNVDGKALQSVGVEGEKEGGKQTSRQDISRVLLSECSRGFLMFCVRCEARWTFTAQIWSEAAHHLLCFGITIWMNLLNQ
jgi:hypothetical protein